MSNMESRVDADPENAGGVRRDIIAGFWVFLIALPLCLGISSACGYQPISGILTAIIGGMVGALISNSGLAIKGPAAGLIAIAIGCVQDFGGDGIFGGWSEADQTAYRMALAVGVAAAVLQILMGLFRSGVLGELFPSAVVHGMLAAIGLIIIAKQIPIVLGVEANGEPLELLLSIPEKLTQLNPEIALIGVVSLIILFGLPWIRVAWLRKLPGPMIVLLISIPLGMYFHLEQTHTYTFGGENFEINEAKHLVNVPASIFQAITWPDFAALTQPRAWKWVMLFAVIGTLESVLSAKAVDGLDPWRRKTDYDRDILAIGVGNLGAALIGGLPMISEIVRSKANIDNGARTRWANFSHGVFLLVFVASVPWLIHRIPMTALAAMLVYTGFRLASPREFARAYQIGREQLVVFLATLIGVLATDLLVGVLIGMGVKLAIHYVNGLPLPSLIKPKIDVTRNGNGSATVVVRQSAVFANWIALRRKIFEVADVPHVTVDLAASRLVDHTVLEKLRNLEFEFHRKNRVLEIRGLDTHDAVSDHPLAARRKGYRATGI